MMRKFPPQQKWKLPDEKEGWKYLNSDLLLVACCLCLLLMLWWTVVGSRGSSPTWPASTPALRSSSTTCFSCSGNWICTIFTSAYSNLCKCYESVLTSSWCELCLPHQRRRYLSSAIHVITRTLDALALTCIQGTGQVFFWSARASCTKPDPSTLKIWITYIGVQIIYLDDVMNLYVVKNRSHETLKCKLAPSTIRTYHTTPALIEQRVCYCWHWKFSHFPSRPTLNLTTFIKFKI